MPSGEWLENATPQRKSGRLARGEPSPAILVRLDDVNRSAALVLRQPAE